MSRHSRNTVHHSLVNREAVSQRSKSIAEQSDQRQECQPHSRPASPTRLRNQINQHLSLRLLALFDEADNGITFFQLWNEALLFAFKHLRGQMAGDALARLDFRLHVYFATNLLRKIPSDKQEYKRAIVELKKYLEDGPGVEMATNPELVQFFALPYVRDPQKHPVFKRIIQREWINELRADLSANLSQIIEASCYDSIVAKDFLKLLQNTQSVRKNREKSTGRYRPAAGSSDSLHPAASEEERSKEALCQSHKCIAQIISQFVNFLETSCKENAIAPEMLASFSRRLKLAADAQKMSHTSRTSRWHRTRNGSECGSDVTANVTHVTHAKGLATKPCPHGATSSSSGDVPELPPSKQAKHDFSVVPLLDYVRIIHHIVINPDRRTSSLLLQAIRQQLTRTNSMETSKRNLQLLIDNDILSLKNRKTSIVTTILRHNESNNYNMEMKEELARLLHTIASFRSGRDYLLSVNQGKELLYETVLALKTERVSGHAASHLLAVLQKLSIRSMTQKELLLCGTFEWLLLRLDLSGSNSLELSAAISTALPTTVSTSNPSVRHNSSTLFVNFGLEYALCLLSNMLLNTVAQTTALRYRHQIVAILSYLLTHKPVMTRQICRTLYCVMGMYARVRLAARERDLNAVLDDRINKALNHDAYCHLYAVRQILRGEATFERRTTNDDDEAESEDYLEAEIDSTDSLRPTLADLFGEQLLLKKFSTTEAFESGSIASEKAAEKIAAGSQSHQKLTNPRLQNKITHPKTKNRDNQSSSSRNYRSQRNKKYEANTIQTGGSTNAKCAVDCTQMTPKGMVSVSFAADERINSVMSHMTFVLENDKPKPLMVRCGFEKVVSELAASSSVAAKAATVRSASLMNMHVSTIPEERHTPPPPEPTFHKIVASLPIPPARKSTVTRASRSMTFGHRSARSVRPMSGTPPAVSGSDKRGGNDKRSDDKKSVIGERVDEIDECANAFTSRPKIMRTPQYRD